MRYEEEEQNQRKVSYHPLTSVTLRAESPLRGSQQQTAALPAEKEEKMFLAYFNLKYESLFLPVVNRNRKKS